MSYELAAGNVSLEGIKANAQARAQSKPVRSIKMAVAVESNADVANKEKTAAKSTAIKRHIGRACHQHPNATGSPKHMKPIAEYVGPITKKLSAAWAMKAQFVSCSR
jgi:hypothetical protein